MRLILKSLLIIIVLSLIIIPVSATVIEFTSSDVWEVPAGVASIDVIVVGGGGGGEGGETAFEPSYGGDGGNAGTINSQNSISVTPGQTLTITVGIAGTAGVHSGGNGGAGGSSSITGTGVSVSAAGGAGGSGSSGTYAGLAGANGYGSGSYASAGSDGCGESDWGYGGAAGTGRGAGGGGGGGCGFEGAGGAGGAGAAGYIQIEYTPSSPPAAAFSGSPTSGTAPLEVSFTDASTGTPTAWYWDIDNNGETDYTTQNCSHTYTSAGTYTVNLTAVNVGGSDSEIKTDYITVSAPPTTTVSPTPTTSTPTPTSTMTSTLTATPTPPPFGPDFITFSGVHIRSTTEITSYGATLNGYVDDPGNYTVGWFLIGTASNSYGWHTDEIDIEEGTGNFTADIEGFPLIAGETFYARAGCVAGYSIDEDSFSLPAASMPVVPTFGQYWDLLRVSDMSPEAIWEVIPLPYADVFGGGDGGFRIFVGFILTIIFSVLWMKQEDASIPMLLGFIVGGMLLALLPPELVAIAYSIMVLAIAGAGYTLFRKR